MSSTFVKIAIAACTVSGTAHADTFYADFDDSRFSEKPRPASTWFDPAMYTGIGVGIHLGGGVTGFTDAAMRDSVAAVGGMWNLRAALGTHVPLALELGYLGSVTEIKSQFGQSQATLVGTTFEAAARYNFMPQHSVVSPYVFAGLGWQQFTIDDRTFQLSDTGIATEDDLLVMPFGAGLGYRFGAITTDVRGTVRAARGEGLVLEDPKLSLETGAGGFAPMHQWDASVNVGYEF